MLALMALRLPIGLAMMLVGGVGYIQLNGLDPFLNYIRTTPYQIFANYTLSVIPLFVLMGAFAERSGLAGDLFGGLRAGRPSPRRARHGGDRRLHRLRRDLRLGGGDDRDLRARGAAGAAALSLRSRLLLRRRRRRRDARHPDPAFGHPRRLCDLDRAEHRQAVQGGADSRADGGGDVLRHHRDHDPARPRDRPGAAAHAPGASGCGRCSACCRRRWWRSIVVGGIYGGVFTPTEGASVGAFVDAGDRAAAPHARAARRSARRSCRRPRPRR